MRRDTTSREARLVVRHEAMALGVAQQAAVAATALGDEDAGREDAGRMELHRLHVAERRHAGLERQRMADALVDDRIRGDPVQAARAAGGHHRCARHAGRQLAGDQVAHHRPVAALAVVDERQRLGALQHRNARGDRLVAHGEQHGVAGAVGGVAGAPLLGAAEVALGDEPVRVVLLGQRHLLAVDDHLAVAAADAAPGHAPRRQLAHRLRRGVDEHAHHVLVGAPVAAADRVLEVDVLVVAVALDDVAEARLHAALRRDGVRALGRDQRQHQRVEAAAPGADRHAQAGQPAADDQDVGVDDLHGACSSGWSTQAGT